MLDHAQQYHDWGYCVIPVGSDKRPLVDWKEYQTSRPTDEQVEQWWGEQFPSAGIAIVCGAVSNDLIVIDVDKPNNPWPEDPNERATLQEAGGISLTGGGGKQYFFRLPEAIFDAGNTAGSLASNVDTRANGGYVVVPPSLHPTGNNYAWAPQCELDGPVSEIAPLPDWLERALRALSQPKGAPDPSKYDRLLAGVGEGERDQAATVLAGRYVAMGMSESEVLDLLLQWNQRNRPPMSDKQVSKVVRSIVGREGLKAKPITDLEEIDDQKKDEILAAVNSKFALKILSVRWVGGDDPFFRFEMQTPAGERVARVPSEQMASWINWAKQIVKAASRLPESLGRKESWSTWANMIMALSHGEEIHEATIDEQVRGWVCAYLTRKEIRPYNSARSVNSPVHRTDDEQQEVALNLSDLGKFVRAAFDGHIRSRMLAQHLNECGFQSVTMRGKTEDGKDWRGRRWVVPSDLIESVRTDLNIVLVQEDE